MRFTPLLAAVMVCGFSTGAQAGSIYLCKAYTGGTFWAQQHCSQHSALIERIANVPDTLPFSQQVEIARQQQSAATEASQAGTTTTQTYTQPGPDQPTECKALKANVAHYDAMARQPQSGQMQDWISAQRRTARNRQFKLRC